MRTSERVDAGALPAGWLRALVISGRSALSSAWRAIGRLCTPEPVPEPFEAGESRVARVLVWPGVVGTFGSLLVLWGASQPTSPFTLDHATLKTLSDPALQYGVRLWYFGTGAPIGNVLVGVVAVYTGMFLMMRAWVALARLTRLHPGTPVRRFVPVFIAWMLPLLIVAPLFSHDAFSYVAQGEEMTRHINPYLYPPSLLGPGGNPFASLVDKLWANSTSPYGPIFLSLAGGIVALVNHNELEALLGFRLLAVVGVVLLGVYMPRLARSYGVDAAKSFVLIALNPLVLLHLVAGEHNDALMMGLLVAGLALARERHPLVGIVVCSLAALVKVPALVGVVYIGWDWAGVGVSWRSRVRPLAKAVAVSGATMAAVTYAIGLGWGWIGALSNPASVSSWMDPATGIGGLVARIVNGVGLGEHAPTIVAVARWLGLAAAAGVAVWLLLRSDGGVGSFRGLGLTMLAVVVLGPVVQPWYLVWGLVLLAPLVEGRARSALMLASAVLSFLGLPGGRMLLGRLAGDGPLVLLDALAVLAAVGVASFAPRLYQLAKQRRDEPGHGAGDLAAPAERA